MTNNPARFSFSPSLHHRHGMATADRPLTYDGGDLTVWRRSLRSRLLKSLGDMPQRRVPLNVRRLWSRAHPLGKIDKIVFTAEPHCDVPAYVCTPTNAAPPYPFMICLQGHSSGMHNSIAVQQDHEDKRLAVKGDRDFAIGCMQRGIAALCIEQRSLGERAEKTQSQICPHSRCHDAFVQALMLGRTLLGERLFDVDRATFRRGKESLSATQTNLSCRGGGRSLSPRGRQRGTPVLR